MEIIWTKHAEERQKQWEQKLKITKREIEKVLNSPEQIVSGDMGVLIAQSRNRDGLLRVLFIQEGKVRKIITIYWTSKVEKYWKEGKSDKDKI
ncbi:MAG: hypothetical protein ACP5PC_07745 [bacterium]